ncbi:MAG: PIN domain-containing protein [Candidatus Aminicenantes bacterium]|nr:PIN domain-containing protein [Candidatus Aminicenantes bacterium]NIM79071.1 PIN domain-containing protein [Candidatus Aminicenantes bacterium]NIN18350.1 PIN domain-containing protein [Candidatus Aminicenantes bacterium]NIN42237.1 PIN domain-containing protein [Candidatus Aminicenantes bacterium]NIN85003.1 PIN domain-containing protein [Candidatus Aminicenantes bacterium]
MEYLLDTVTLVRYLSKTGKLTVKVKTIFDQADDNLCKLIVSTISFMEILYLAEKNRIPVSLKEVVEKVRLSTIYKVVNLSTEIVLTAQSVNFHELHDRLILATAKYLDIPIISSDDQFKEVKEIEVIW